MTKRAALTVAALSIAALVVAAVAALAGLLWFGAYNVAATKQHLAPTYWLLDTALRRSVVRRAQRIEVPPLDDPVQVARGAVRFGQYCAQCHGAPGVAPEPFALGLNPPAANLAQTARVWQPAELYWTIKQGIKMTGMPAWAFRLNDEDIWAIVAFLRVLPGLSPQAYRRLAERAAAMPEDTRERALGAGGRAPDPQRGKIAIQQYACVTCHAIPGIVGADAPVGPPLAGVGTRVFIAGVLPNTRDTMIQWLQSPQSIRPQGAMPNLGVTEQDAADIAAYLATLK